MKFESRKGPKKKKGNRMSFVSWKTYLSYYYSFITHFPLHFKDD